MACGCWAWLWYRSAGQQEVNLLAYWSGGFVMPNVRGKAGPTVKRQAHAADDSLRCRVGLAFCRWGSPLTEGLGLAHASLPW